MLQSRYACPCCGYRTYALPAGGTMQICPVCFWEDAPGGCFPGDYYYNGSNGMSLYGAQVNFENMGACEQDCADIVRPPFPEEARASDWISIDGERMALILLIEEAFENVRIEDGMTLHQAEVLDNYGGEEAYREAAGKDTEIRWQHVPMKKISRFSSSMCFLDVKGFRFYLPAFMVHALKTYKPESASEAEGVMWALSAGPNEGYYHKQNNFLAPTQKKAVAAFLRFFANTADCYNSIAEEALKNGWDVFLPNRE